MRKTIVIAPFPPPITGQSKVTLAVVEALKDQHRLDFIDIGKNSLESGSFSLSRVSDYLKIFYKFFRLKKTDTTFVYHSIAESFLGNMRDIILYILNYSRLKNHYIHMLGGTGMRQIISSKSWQGRLNKFFIKKLGGVIVEGNVNKNAFGNVIDKAKIHIIPNFSETYIFSNNEIISEKYADQNMTEISILYLSNLLPGKGYMELAKAFLALEEEDQNKLKLSFVGSFESENDEVYFLNMIKDNLRLTYLGKFIDHNAKKKLYDKTHVFCLPTYYPYEGLPIAILEAYAAGCAIITTAHSGIPDVFSDGVNGFAVEKGSVESLKNCLKNLNSNKERLIQFAFTNRDQALKNHRIETFSLELKKIFGRENA